VKYKLKTEVLHNTHQAVQGDEPFLRYPRPHMIVNLSNGYMGSHNFFEGYFESISRIKKGDMLSFQMVRTFPVEMKWYERVWEWLKEIY